MAGVVQINSRMHSLSNDNSITGGQGPLEVALARKLLYPVYQPIVDLSDSVIFGSL
jgi:sensor c-di-GMP phosphodiesterase-like protein